MGSFYMYGFMTLVKACSTLAFLSWYASLSEFKEMGATIVTATWGIGALSTLGNLPVFIVWIVTVDKYAR